MGKPLMSIGRFGVHLKKTPAKTWTFVGTVPSTCDKSYKTYEEGLKEFFEFLKAQPVEWQREHISDLRTDIWTQYMQFLNP